MLRGGWRSIIKVAGLSLLLFAGYALFSALSWHSTSLENEAAQRTNIHAQNAENRIERVCLSPIAEPDCVEDARQAQRENEREEQDLAAQKVTAWWTKVMGMAALIGMALSAVGVWLVKTTFDETRKANFLSKAQQRGRIELNFHGGVGSDTGNLVIAIEGRNIGHSTATNCRISVEYGRQIPENYTPQEMDWTSRIITGQSAANLASYSHVEHRADGYFLFGVVTYNCIFGDFHETYFCVKIIPARSVPDHSNSSLITAIPCKPANWPNDT